MKKYGVVTTITKCLFVEAENMAEAMDIVCKRTQFWHEKVCRNGLL